MAASADVLPNIIPDISPTNCPQNKPEIDEANILRSQKENKDIASNAKPVKIEVIEIPGKGRGVVVREPVSCGQIILEEAPFILGPKQSSPLVCIECCATIQGMKLDWYYFFTETHYVVQLYHAQSWKNILFASVYNFEYILVYSKDNKMLDYIVTAERVDARY